MKTSTPPTVKDNVKDSVTYGEMEEKSEKKMQSEDQIRVEEEKKEHSRSISEDENPSTTSKPSNGSTDITKLSEEKGVVNPGADLSDVL